MYRLLRPLLLAGLILPLLAGWMALAHAAPTPAGTLISNTATATYIDAASGNSVRLTSNTVSTTVTALEALSLTANQNLIFAPGSRFTSTHVLSNTGNVATTYLLSTSLPPRWGFRARQCAGGAGRQRQRRGRPRRTGHCARRRHHPGRWAKRQPAHHRNHSSHGPAGAKRASHAHRHQPAAGATASNTDTLNIVNSAVLQVSLAASVATSTPGSSLGLTATASNTGNAAAGSVP
jgi:hypothetical protein